MAQSSRDLPWDKGGGYSWESLGEGLDDVDAPFDYDDVLQEEAGGYLAEYLTELKHSDILKANHVCILAFWAQKAGACGVDKFSAKPIAGHFSRHFDSAVGQSLNSDDFYKL